MNNNKQNVLINNDCVKTMKGMTESSIDLILTDPPYNLGKFMKKRATNLKGMRDNFFGAAGWDDLTYQEWLKSIQSFFIEAARVIKPGGSLIIFMAAIKVETVIKAAENSGFYYKTTGIWHKQNPMPRNMNLHFVNSTESWIYFTYSAKTGTFNNKGKMIHDYFECPVAPISERRFGTHPTQKPERLMSFFIELLTNVNDVVLDPFMGSGSTGVAAQNMNRRFIGIELNEKYFNIANERINTEILYEAEGN